MNKVQSVILACLIFLPTWTHAAAQTTVLGVNTQECSQGKLLHPIHIAVSIFDVQKVPGIMRTQEELRKTLKQVNSDPNAIQKAEALYSKLRKLVAKTPALARSKDLPYSGFRFEIAAAQKVVVFAFYDSEFESFTYAAQEIEVSRDHPNEATLNFPSEEECKGVQ